MMNQWEKEDKEESSHKISDETREMYLNALEEQRIWLREENRNNPKIDEEYIRHYLVKLDLEEEKIKDWFKVFYKFNRLTIILGFSQSLLKYRI